MTDKGRVALSYGRILTPSHDASCGIRLKPGRRYLLTGNIRGGKPWINLCNWNHDWDKMTAIQRKGFRRLYQRGCDCKVKKKKFLNFISSNSPPLWVHLHNRIHQADTWSCRKKSFLIFWGAPRAVPIIYEFRQVALPIRNNHVHLNKWFLIYWLLIELNFAPFLLVGFWSNKNRSIAVKMFYKKSFGFELIEWKVGPLYSRKVGEVSADA